MITGNIKGRLKYGGLLVERGGEVSGTTGAVILVLVSVVFVFSFC